MGGACSVDVNDWQRHIFLFLRLLLIKRCYFLVRDRHRGEILSNLANYPNWGSVSL